MEHRYPSNTTAPSTVVWIQTAFLGDIVLSTAAFRLLRQVAPNTRQILITTEVGRQAVGSLVDECVVFDKRRGSGLLAMFDLRRRLRLPADTVILQLHRSTRSSLLAWWLGRKVVTYVDSSLSWLADLRIARLPVWHEAQRSCQLLEVFGVSREQMLEASPTLGCVRKEQGQRRIGVAPGSVWGTKRWPLENYIEWIDRWHTAHPADQIVVIGSPDEREYARTLSEAFANRSWVENRIGRTKIADLADVFANLDLLLCNDSAPIHFASAVNTPTVAIFGATVPGFGFGPLASRSKVIERKEVPCRPCSSHGPMQCPLGHFRCMRDISVGLVSEVVSTILEDKLEN